VVATVYLKSSYSGTVKYLVPEKMYKNVYPLQRVLVPFNDKKEIGLIVHLHSEAKGEQKNKLKEVIRLVDKTSILNQEQFDLSQKIVDHYLCNRNDVLFSMIPAGVQTKVIEEVIYDDFLLPDLNSDQQTIIDNIIKTQKKNNKPEVHLIHGVTGSGKTRIYIELIKKYLDKNLGVIFLLPEIALSYQFVIQLKPLFGNKMAILHSGLGRSARISEYRRVLSGEANLVVGTRSAVFAPIKDLGLVIIDEEHDSSYKENFSPKYHAKWVAFTRLHKSQWPYLLPLCMVTGSATPLVETSYLARAGRIGLHKLEKRATGYPLPAIRVVEYDSVSPETDIISPYLIECMRNHLKAGKQIILLLNRRGYNNYLFCRKCQEPVMCPHCSLTLTSHRKDRDDEKYLKCHICGFQSIYKTKCSICQSKLQIIGSGIQKVEDAVEFHFPGVEFARMDQDVSKTKGFVEDLLQDMRNGKIKILIGTQMVAKGFDLPGVTLVGLLNADIGLNLPDFRASERVFQLIVQFAGRSGRHETGEVILQTMQPEHHAIKYASEMDYEKFYQTELDFRKKLNYPPFIRIVRFLISGSSEDENRRYLQKLNQYIDTLNHPDLFFNEEKKNSLPMEILGPLEAPLYKLKDLYRHHLIIKDHDFSILQNFSIMISHFFLNNRQHFPSIKYEIDVDPVEIL